MKLPNIKQIIRDYFDLSWIPSLITRKERNRMVYQISVLEDGVKQLKERLNNGAFVFGIDFAKGEDKSVIHGEGK